MALPASERPHRKLNPRSEAHLDAIRGLAAIAVFVGHARALLLADARDVGVLGPLGKAAYYLTGFGHQSVVVFFVLSGFLVGGSVFRSVEKSTFKWGTYLLQRGSRLYTVLLPALLLTLAWDRLGIALFGLGGTFYGGNTLGAAVAKVDANATLSPGILVGNLLFLQTLLVPCYGTNSPLWSLANEAWYYLLFPCLLLAATRRPLLLRLGHTAVAIAIMLFLPREFLEGFVCWCAGALVAFLFQRSIRLPTAIALASVPALGVMVHLTRVGIVRSDVAPSRTTDAYRRAAHVLAAGSYTLYVTHFPPLVFVQAALATRAQPGLREVALLLCVVASIAAYSWAVSRVTEARTNSVRDWLQRRLNHAQT